MHVPPIFPIALALSSLSSLCHDHALTVVYLVLINFALPSVSLRLLITCPFFKSCV